MRVRVLGFLLILVGLPAPAVSQPPPGGAPPPGGPAHSDTLRNLKVLPKTMTRREVIGVMRGFSSGLGVRCQYCHKGEEGKPLDTFDFASDEKRTKETARLMMKMVQDINGQQLTKIPDRPKPEVAVTCMTCHRGIPRPQPLGQAMVNALEAGGPDSARSAYRTLKERYYGRAAYDFGEPSLIGAALDLARDKRYDQALALLALNDEQFPSSANTQDNIGDVQLARGDTTKAIAAYRAALQRDSTDFQAKGRLRGLGQR
jgi:hypothetical protein